MDPVFTLPYPEYSVIAEISDQFKKGDGCSCYVPVSRQEKDVDFVLRNSISRKHLSFQVKSSRSYEWKEQSTSGHVFWFRNFLDRFQPGKVDYYVLFGVYPTYSQAARVSSKNEHWNSMLLCFNNTEMQELLQSIKMKKTNRPDSFFGIWTDSGDQFYGGRGFEDDPNLTQHLLENKKDEIRKALVS